MFRIIPRDEAFFAMFEKASQNALDGALVLKDLLDHFDDVKEKARQIEEIEHKGDILTHKIAEPTPQAKELGFLILKSTRELHRGVTRLSTKMDEVFEHCVEVNSLENEADRVCRDAIAQLFDQEKDPIYILKWKEIYETLESATDRCEDAANVLEGVALKNA